jgi:NTE family protein
VLTDGGVYDNHGIEPALKRCRWVLVSDGGAPWRASSSGFYNWFSQLRRVFDTTDNQVRALRRRDIIARFKAGEEADEFGLPPGATMRERAAVRGVYWSIGLNPSHYPAQQTVAFTPTSTTRPADIQTYLRSPGERETADLVNWGYAASDIALRSHYAPPPEPVSTLPVATDVAW